MRIITGAEAVMKMRCSAGFEVGEYYGPGILNPAADEVRVQRR